MASIDAYIYIIIGLLGVAYPVLLQIVARLDEKYCSDKIVELFNKEKVNKIFRISLITSLFLLIVWSLNLPPIFNLSFLEDSASTLLALSTIILTFSFFIFVNKTLKYYTPNKFIAYLIKKSNKQDKDLLFFAALSDLLILYIRKQETNYSTTLNLYFYEQFSKERNKDIAKPISYPDQYYDIVKRAIEELATIRPNRFYNIVNSTSGEGWFLSQDYNHIISQKTYRWMWNNILIAIENNQDDLIIEHWKTCHQHYTYKFKRASNINTDCYTFLEFHYALGGLLLYKERYKCINRMFRHTQSYPPKYELLPEIMNEVFNFYFKICGMYIIDHNWEYKYPFPETEGILASVTIKKWTMSYMAILFLRQYTIIPYMTYMHPLDKPTFPSSQGEIKYWIDELDYFKALVENHLQNSELLKMLNLDFITLEWCTKNEKPHPISFIESLKTELNKKYDYNSISIRISESKRTKFNNSTKAITKKTFKEIQEINNKTDINKEVSNIFKIYGESNVIQKDVFSDEPETCHGNYDSYLAESIVIKIQDNFASILCAQSCSHYLLQPKDIFKAVDIIAKNEDILIINFGIDIKDYTTKFKINNIKTYNFNNNRFLKNSLYIIRTNDLPNIISNEIDSEVITEYQLEKISDNPFIYTSIIDMNREHDNIYNNNKMGLTDDQLKKSFLLCIMIDIDIIWKKNVNAIVLQEYNEYFQRGIMNNIKDVKGFAVECQTTSSSAPKESTPESLK